jgi:acylglycerol lipase
VIDAAYKTQEKRDEIRGNPYCYKDKPRLKTAYELLKVSLELEQKLLHQVSKTIQIQMLCLQYISFSFLLLLEHIHTCDSHDRSM